ncbi:MAG: hypothetical protein PHV02_10480 [Rhodocyclaceae bacterium]|nr:hypothetical protein [Rhodocyclaceae bacterium]
MENNKKAAQVASTGTAQNNTIDKHFTKTDPLQGWYSLGADVKPSRTERTVKKSWKRGRK